MDIEVTVMIIHAEVVPNHIIDATTEALHDTITPALIITTVTCHTGDLHHVEAYQSTPEIAAGPSYKPSKNTSSKSSSSSSRATIKPQDKKQKRVTIDNPQLDYYTSDDTSSDSEDDFN